MISSLNPSPLDHIIPYLQGLGLVLSPDEDLSLYEQALTHSSYTYEYKLSSLHNYERLEFLGDAVLKIVISQYLFLRFPRYREGDLTKIRAVVVSDLFLSKFARQIQLGNIMILGPSEARNGGHQKNSNIACAFEALLGALYLNGQMDFITHFIETLVAEEVTQVDLSKTKDNYKAVLQELTQADGDGLPEYRTAREEGPAHHRTFYIEVLINGEVLGHGSGQSKKEAQQMAAKMALETLQHQPDEIASPAVEPDHV